MQRTIGVLAFMEAEGPIVIWAAIAWFRSRRMVARGSGGPEGKCNIGITSEKVDFRSPLEVKITHTSTPGATYLSKWYRCGTRSWPLHSHCIRAVPSEWKVVSSDWLLPFLRVTREGESRRDLISSGRLYERNRNMGTLGQWRLWSQWSVNL
jgi:hypothetical protein